MAQSDLIPINQLTEEEQKEFVKKGGVASGIARRKKRALKEVVKMIVGLKVTDEIRKRLENISPELAENLKIEEAIALGQVNGAIKGNPKCAEWIRDTMGEKPIERYEDTTETSKIDEFLEKITEEVKQKTNADKQAS